MPFIVKIMPDRRIAKSRRSAASHHVVALAYEGLATFEFGIVVELFGLPRPELDPWYTFEACGVERGLLKATGGISILPRRGLSAILTADTVVATGWRNPDEPPPRRLMRALIDAHDRGARLVSICSGLFVLAATGLLDGRRATTHWRYIEKVRRMYPRIHLEPDVLYVDEGDILTSAGSAAGIDLGLHIIRKDYGTLAANTVARRLVVSPHREGGQAQFIDKPVSQQTSPWLAQLLDWVQGRLADPISVDQLARQAHTSKRTLSRRFADALGTSPMDWVTSLRVRHAKDLLETTARSVEEIADECGFGSAPTLRHHFRAKVALSPNAYRRRFQRMNSPVVSEYSVRSAKSPFAGHLPGRLADKLREQTV
jgi:AraC family transcriptional regulator, transcriptional activator FtrA